MTFGKREELRAEIRNLEKAVREFKQRFFDPKEMFEALDESESRNRMIFENVNVCIKAMINQEFWKAYVSVWMSL